MLFYPNGSRLEGYWRNDIRDENSVFYEYSESKVTYKS